MKRPFRIFLAAAYAVTVMTMTAPAFAAASTGQMKADVLSIAREWAQIKYLSKSSSERKSKMKALGAKADALARRNPGRVDVLIWDGIITSERASLTWGLSALKLAKAARNILQKAYKMDPVALDAGAPTSLGVLYYRVPGFPIAFGDKEKAGALLQEAVRNAPNGRDAHYFYADYLYRQGKYRKAEQVLLRGMKLPDHPERPLWNRIFPKVMQGLLARIREKE